MKLLRRLCVGLGWMILCALWAWMAVCIIAIFSGIGWIITVGWMVSTAAVLGTQMWDFGRRVLERHHGH
jgi:hypothetical protein